MAVAALSACSPGTSGANSPAPSTAAPSGADSSTPSQPTPAPTGSGSATTTSEAAVTSIRITIDGRTIDADLADNPTARDLARQLPLTLTFSDYGGQEKTAELPRELTMDGAAPGGDDPETNDIGYYAPNNVLVLYYSDVDRYPGIVRLGTMDADDMAFIRGRSDAFEAQISAG